MIMKISEQFFLEYSIFLHKCSYNIARAHKLPYISGRFLVELMDICVQSQ